MPTEGRVLCVHRHGFVDAGDVKLFREINADAIHHDEGVKWTHWMPLPNPPTATPRPT
jgi:hypothetical protein